jgi:glyoxylate carboligase
MVKGSDLLVAALENESVDQIFGIPGEENLDVVESIRKSSMQLVISRHEQAAAFVAATYGRLTGKPGVCIATLGPGALNFSTGAAYALLGAMAMIMVTGQKGHFVVSRTRIETDGSALGTDFARRRGSSFSSGLILPRDAFMLSNQFSLRRNPYDTRVFTGRRIDA